MASMADTGEVVTTCVIVGGGPAGIIAGWLLARAGVAVTVLEKHPDFNRDFRGDTIHPSTLRLMDQLGVLEQFLKIEHRKEVAVKALTVDGFTEIGSFKHFGKYGYLAFMPQWDFLDFAVAQADKFKDFTLLRNTTVQDLIVEDSRVVGVTALSPDGPLTVRADLVIAADGRRSVVRAAAALPMLTHGSPIDVIWYREPRVDTDPNFTYGETNNGSFTVHINRNSYWQVGRLIPKGTAPQGHAGSLLEVQVNRLYRWHRDGLLCIGDAAHAMSPVGGVGINLAIQDAVAASKILAGPLKAGTLTENHLAKVQKRRERTVRVIQRVQVQIQKRVIYPVLTGDGGPVRLPAPVRFLLRYVPIVKIAPAWLVGLYGAEKTIDLE
jgi:2-polyprenyl-6-methoxyphenol hydroxylase-like FAD-dependent oxidoreductase